MTALLLGLAAAAFIIALGLLTYYLAPLVGPNPIFGVRTGYSQVSREVWDRSNRAGGLGLGVAGLALAGASPVAVLAAPDERTAYLAIGCITIVLVLVVAAWTFVYSRRLARAAPAAASLVSVPLRWPRLAPALLGLAFTAANGLVALAVLPSGPVAVHFDITGAADGWSSAGGLVGIVVGAAAVLTAIVVVVNAVGTREPSIAISRLGRLYLPPERGLAYLAWAIALTHLFMVLVLWDVVYFNIKGAHLGGGPATVVLVAVALLVAAVLGLFFVLARRAAPPEEGGN